MWEPGWLDLATQATVSPTEETMAPISGLPGVPMCALLSRAGCIVWEQIEDSRALPPRGSEVVVTPVSRQ